MKHFFEISGMHCQSCVGKISTALKAIHGIKTVKVTLDPPEAVIEMDTHIELSELNTEIKSLGAYNLSEKTTSNESSTVSKEPESLRPLFIILSYIIGGTFLQAILSQDTSVHIIMGNFMGGFFIVFSLFKMIDLPGFADGYSTYDIIAKRSRIYALAYPFIELTLGILYFCQIELKLVSVFTFLIMAISSVGVLKALLNGRKIKCACLGTSLKLPMTKVTLIEDFGMVLMAVFMLLI